MAIYKLKKELIPIYEQKGFELIKLNNNYMINRKGEILGLVRGKILSNGGYNNKGYIIINLFNNGIPRGFTLHRLVALQFLPTNNTLLQINHKDGNKNNNKVENLEWVTASQNITHAWNLNLYKKRYKKIFQYDLDGNVIKLWDSLTEASKILNIPMCNISQNCTGKRKSAGGFFWIYYETNTVN